MNQTQCAYCGSLNGGHTLACQSIHKDTDKPAQIPLIPQSPTPAASGLDDAAIIEIRDQFLPSQGEPFDTLALGRAVALAAQPAPGVGGRVTTPYEPTESMLREGRERIPKEGEPRSTLDYAYYVYKAMLDARPTDTRPAESVVDRGRPTNRREQAVQHMLAEGWKWDGLAWCREPEAQPAPGVGGVRWESRPVDGDTWTPCLREDYEDFLAGNTNGFREYREVSTRPAESVAQGGEVDGFPPAAIWNEEWKGWVVPHRFGITVLSEQSAIAWNDCRDRCMKATPTPATGSGGEAA